MDVCLQRLLPSAFINHPRTTSETAGRNSVQFLFAVWRLLRAPKARNWTIDANEGNAVGGLSTVQKGNPSKWGVVAKRRVRRAHDSNDFSEIFRGCEFFLVPSRFERVFGLGIRVILDASKFGRIGRRCSYPPEEAFRARRSGFLGASGVFSLTSNRSSK